MRKVISLNNVVVSVVFVQDSAHLLVYHTNVLTKTQ
jgi:hypothetical protein